MTGGPPFDPWPAAEVHVEWGAPAARLAAERGDAVVVVDVLSFSTTVTVAVERDLSVLVYAPAEVEALGGREAAGRRLGARPTSPTRDVPPGELSLSPAVMLGADPGQRVLLTSLNGAVAAAATSASPAVFVGALRNGSACARLAAQVLRDGRASRVTVVACGEQWSSVEPDCEGFRPALEDWVGAGFVAGRLADQGCTLSPEAAAAVPRPGAVTALAACVSARELVAAGWGADVALAFDADASDAVAGRDAGDPAGRTFRRVTT